jgi:DNA polymerase-1
MPSELAQQVPTLKNALKTMGVCIAEKEGLEADDIIGIISKKNKINNMFCAFVFVFSAGLRR